MEFLRMAALRRSILLNSTGRSWPDLIDRTFCDFTVMIVDGWSGSAPGDR
jgi:hypothetical protein